MAGALDVGLAQFWFDRAGDAGRDLVLQLENVVERAVEAFGPDVSAVVASTSCPVMRTRLPALRTLPSST
jgi:hypothetical protein